MAKGSRITPFLLSNKSKDPPTHEPERPQSAGNPARMSTSSIFPGLRRLETTGADGSLSCSSRQSVANVLGPLLGAPPPSGSSSAATSASGVTTPPIVTLKLTGPSFLDVVAKDSVTKQPVYIMETVRDSTFMYRLDSATNEAIKAATVQWPPTVTKGRSSGRSVQMYDGRWRDSEEFLKFGTLTNFLNRRFQLPHFPYPLKWKPAPGSSFHCTTQGVKGPIAILEAAYLEAPPRLRVYNTLADGDRERSQQNYNGVPVVLLDYLMATSLLLVTEVQEWLDRKQSASGMARIPGSSSRAIKKWLAVIHNEPPSPTTESPATATSSSTWESRSTNRMSGGTSSIAGSSSSDPMTPSTPATSTHSLFSRRDSEIPPVPPLPEAARARKLAPTLSVAHPYSTTGLSSSEPSPSATAPGSSSAPVTGTCVTSRPLPRPPIRSGSTRRPSSAEGNLGPSPSPSPSPPPLPSSTPPATNRSSSPSASSSSTTNTASRRSNTLPRRSLTIANLPPANPPPSSALPLPPKLATEMHRNRVGSAPSAGHQQNGGGLQMVNPDPLPQEEEERLRQNMRALAISRAGPIPASSSGAYMMVPVGGPSGEMVDAGMIRVPAASRRAYVDAVFEQPPPAYDAIDFSLQAQVHLAPRSQSQPRF